MFHQVARPLAPNGQGRAGVCYTYVLGSYKVIYLLSNMLDSALINNMKCNSKSSNKEILTKPFDLQDTSN